MCAGQIVYCCCLILPATSTSPAMSFTHQNKAYLSSQPFFFTDKPFKMSSVTACCHCSSRLSQNETSLSHASNACNICKMWLNWMKEGETKKIITYTLE